MAKTRAQRKAERRRRQQAEQRGLPSRDAAEREQEERAQEDTRHGVSGEVAEAEAVFETGARTEDYGEQVVEQPARHRRRGSPVPGVVPAPVRPGAARRARAPRALTRGRRAPEDGAATEHRRSRSESRRDRRQREKEERRKARAKELQKGQAEKAEKRRGSVLGFLFPAGPSSSACSGRTATPWSRPRP